jgi:pilus assembly protein Flp/PilA
MKKRTEKGQGLVEYALVIILVAIVVIVLVAIFGQAVGNMFSTIVASI